MRKEEPEFTENFNVQEGEINEVKSMPRVQEFGPGEWMSRAFDTKSSERPSLTPEIKEKMDRELVALGTLMQDSGVWWQLDGALNISLRKGEYIGTHVDVDVSVFREDIPRFEEHLSARGYGLFLRKKEDAQRIFRRVGAGAFKWGGGEQPRMMAIDENGEIRKDADLVSAEVAVIERDEKGHAIGWRNTVLPEKWLKNEAVDFHGVPINLSHPGRFLFNKIWFTRGYDEGDLEQFAEIGALSLEDVKDVEDLAAPILKDFEEDKEIAKEHADKIRGRFEKLRGWITKAK